MRKLPSFSRGQMSPISELLTLKPADLKPPCNVDQVTTLNKDVCGLYIQQYRVRYITHYCDNRNIFPSRVLFSIKLNK